MLQLKKTSPWVILNITAILVVISFAPSLIACPQDERSRIELMLDGRDARREIPDEELAEKYWKMLLPAVNEAVRTAKPSEVLVKAERACLTQAIFQNEPDCRYAGFRYLLDIALERNEIVFAGRCLDSLSRTYRFHEEPIYRIRLASHNLSKKEIRERLPAIFEYAKPAMIKFQNLDLHEQILEAIKELERMGGRIRDKTLKAELDAWKARSESLKKKFDGIQPAIKKLKQNFEDPESCGIVGRYYYENKKDYYLACRLLQFGPPGKWSSLYKEFADSGLQPDRMIVVANRWWPKVENGELPTAERAHVIYMNHLCLGKDVAIADEAVTKRLNSLFEKEGKLRFAKLFGQPLTITWSDTSSGVATDALVIERDGAAMFRRGLSGKPEAITWYYFEDAIHIRSSRATYLKVVLNQNLKLVQVESRSFRENRLSRTGVAR